MKKIISGLVLVSAIGFLSSPVAADGGVGGNFDGKDRAEIYRIAREQNEFLRASRSAQAHYSNPVNVEPGATKITRARRLVRHAN